MTEPPPPRSAAAPDVAEPPTGSAIVVSPVETSVPQSLEARVQALLSRMTLEEKIGQMAQLPGGGGHVPHHLREAIWGGRVGSIINEVDPATVAELQRVAREETRLGIPLLIGRDVIHGFATVFPIPLGQASSWNPTLVRAAARAAAREAAARGVNWTFAPMIDIARDPRWGRVAESLGEDPVLTSVLGAAMVRGFQGDDLAAPDSIAACAKHFAGYGASESGRDYNTTNIPEGELRNTYLPPFHAATAAGAASVMTSFSDVNGVPATGNALLLQQILREEWGYDGLVVSDWDSVRQLAVHGFTEDDRASAREAALAGVDMEMASHTYAHHLAALVHDGEVPLARIDAMVANILRLKFRLGLFDGRAHAAAGDAETVAHDWPAADPGTAGSAGDQGDMAGAPDMAREASALDVALEAAVQSIVLLKNEGPVLPLDRAALRTVAVIGPLADDAYEQLGTWIFDGDPLRSVPALDALRTVMGDTITLRHARGVTTTRSHAHDGFDEAVQAATGADVALLFLGEEAILSGEAHCRADISLPGAQEALIHALAATGTPLVLVLMCGRPLALERVEPKLAAILCAWHPGCMGGPAIAELLVGDRVPSGKLPITFPRVTGQVPIYYAHKPGGKPPTPATYLHIDDIPARAPQLSVGNTSFHLDVHYTPLFAFGHGLSYTHFHYENARTSAAELPRDGALTISADVVNTGARHGDEVVQLYVRDLVASVTRPVRELRQFQRVSLAPGERRTIDFTLRADELAFFGRRMTRVVEPGRFHAWIGGSSTAGLHTEFVLVESTHS